MIAGPDGVGKTTIGQQLALRRASVACSDLLGYLVSPDEHRVLYLALDRPRQAARSMRRMVDEADRDALTRGLVAWEGPLPFDLTTHPSKLLAFAQEHEAGTIIIDSLKDVGGSLSDEATGHAINHALQRCLAAGVEIAALHHQRKAQGANKKPRRLEDIFGLRWLTAGCGSVLMVWGDAGDPIVELTHLKQPADEVGPLTLLHDSLAGTTTVHGAVDVVDVLGVTTTPLAARDVARKLFNASDPSRLQVEKAKRRLASAVAEGRAERLHAEPGGTVLWTLPEGVRIGDTDAYGSTSAGEGTDDPLTPEGGGGMYPRTHAGDTQPANGQLPLDTEHADDRRAPIAERLIAEARR
jgi:replicative DNA helicase